MAIYYVNGAFVEAEQAVLPVNDLAVLRGFGAFDYLRTYGGKPFRLPLNIERLQRSAAMIGLCVPYSAEELQAIVLETLRRNAHLADEFTIRLVVTGGVSPDNITPTGKSTLIVMVTPLQSPPSWWYSEGIKAITCDLARLYPEAKSINYIPAIIAQRMAREQGAVEAIYVQDGYVLEGTTTNLFAFYGNTLVTPTAGVLAGITRRTVMELAQSHYRVEARDLPVAEFWQADELFITAANKQVVPVKQVDDRLFNGGRVGERTRHVMELFREETERVARA